MSSHHIIREKQEPALYIHQLGNFDEENLGQLLEWSPTLIVSASDYEKILSLGLKVDIVVTATEPTFSQENTKTIHIKSNELTAVLEYLIAEEYPAVNIIATDASLAGLDAFAKNINLVIFTDIYKSYSVKSGFKIWKPAGTIFLISTNEPFHHTNLRDTGHNLFEVITDGFVEFTFNTPYLFISEQL